MFSTKFSINTAMVPFESFDYCECIMIYDTLETINNLGCFKRFSLEKVENTKLCHMNICGRDSRNDDHEGSNVIYEVKVVIRSKKNEERVKEYFSLIAKVSKNYLYFIPYTVKNEKLVYEVLVPYIKAKYFPYSYVHVEVPYDPPVLILENLTTVGYKIKKDTLDKYHLRICIKVLARFHVDMMKLKQQDIEFFNEFYNDLHGISSSQANQQKAIRKLIAEIETKTLDNNLIKKVKEKCKEYAATVKHWNTNTFAIIIHGCFIRSKILFRYANNLHKPCFIKIIGWQEIKYSSPSIDFGSILITNLPEEINVSKFEAFYHDMLKLYLDQVIARFPELNRETLKQEIIDKLFLSYINYYAVIKTPAHTNFHAIILETFNKLGSLNNNSH